MGGSPPKIMVVASDVGFSRRVGGILADRQADITWEPTLDRVLGRFEEETFDVVLITSIAFRDGDIDGVEVVEVLSAKSPRTQVIFLAEPRHIEIAMSVLKAGTYQYATLPVRDEELGLLIRTAIEQQPKYGLNQLLKTTDSNGQYEDLLGRSEAMQEVYQQIRRAASTEIPVLLVGETGTGKDLVAKTIHLESQRQNGPFVPVNLGALPAELVSSELFGHEKGAFTGAAERREGKFEQGDTGTVFLDEIGTVRESVQVSLLRLLEQREFHRLGGRRAISVDIRLIAATNEDLVGMVEEGRYREDLFYRLDVFRIALPPLRERKGDIPLLAGEFLGRYNRSFKKNILSIAPECMSLFETYDWPGNIRELKNVVQRAVLVCDGEVLLTEHLPPRFWQKRRQPKKVAFEVGTPLNEVEREMMVQALSAADGNKKRAAELLGVSRRSLYSKLTKHGIG